MPGASGNAIKAGEAFVELNADDKKFRDILDKNAARFRKFASGLRNVSIGAVGLGTAILAPLVGATVQSLKLLDTIQDISDRTNSSAESVSRLAYAAKLSATSIEDVEAANKILTKSALAAKDGSVDQADAFKKMGISAEQFMELEIDEKFALIAQGLESLNTQEEKSRYLTALLGKSAAALIPLLSEGSDGLRDLFKEAEELGAVVKSEDAKKAAKTMDNFDKVLTSLKSTIIEVGLSILTLGDNSEDGLKTVMLYIKMARDWVKENKRLVAIIALVGGALIVLGIAGVALGVIISGLVIIFKGFLLILSIVGAVFSPIGLLVIAIAAGVAVLVVQLYYLGRAFFQTTEMGKRLAKILGESFNRVGETFKLMFEGIMAALMKGDFNAVKEIIKKSFEILWIEIKLLTFQVVREITNFFVDGFDSAIMLIKIKWINAFTEIKIFTLNVIHGLLAAIADFTEKFLLGINEILKQAKGVGIDIKVPQIDVGEILKPVRKLIGDINFEIFKLENKKIVIEAKVIEQFDEVKKKRDDATKHVVETFLLEIDKQKAELQKLVEQAQKKPVEAPKFPVAPMPHVAPKHDRFGRPIRVDLENKINVLGDSTKGLFSSADYRQSLALGEANSIAKKQLELNKDVLDELKAMRQEDGINGKAVVDHLAAINAKVGFGEFV